MSTDIPLNAYTITTSSDTITVSATPDLEVWTGRRGSVTLTPDYPVTSAPDWYYPQDGWPEQPSVWFTQPDATQETLPDVEDLVVPEGLEVVGDTYAEPASESELRIFFEIKGPTLPALAARAIPPEVFRRLDLLIKQAIIHAFSLVPKEEYRRTLILEEDEDVCDTAKQGEGESERDETG